MPNGFWPVRVVLVAPPRRTRGFFLLEPTKSPTETRLKRKRFLLMNQELPCTSTTRWVQPGHVPSPASRRLQYEKGKVQRGLEPC